MRKPIRHTRKRYRRRGGLHNRPGWEELSNELVFNNSPAPFNMPNRLNPNNIRRSQSSINTTDTLIRKTQEKIETLEKRLSTRDSSLKKLDTIKKSCLDHTSCAARYGIKIDPTLFKSISAYIENTKSIYDADADELAKLQEKLEQLIQKSKNLRNSQFKSGILVKRNRIKFNSFGGSTRKYRK